jgi:hypothetical protein
MEGINRIHCAMSGNPQAAHFKPSKIQQGKFSMYNDQLRAVHNLEILSELEDSI